MQLKIGYFIVEGLNSFSTVYYLYYLYFHVQHAFGFDNKANLALAALSGVIYMVTAWLGGKFAQRFGYFKALKLGFIIMIAALSMGPRLHFVFGQILVMAGTVIGMCFTWPTLEALISEGETPAGLQRNVGIYNIVWAGTAALAYFNGGAMLEQLGPQSLFYVPIAILLAQLGFTLWLEAQARRLSLSVAAASRRSTNNLNPSSKPETLQTAESNPRPVATARMFVRMAWLANPFAYIAINTLIASMPGVAKRLELSTTAAGFCCSVWCFARVAAFFALWFWDGWHYRFRWLLAAYLALAATFSFILLAPNLLMVVGAQIIFGSALGLIYYSSLFYSMDISETKGEHGGIHEGAIGLGNAAGPAVGAVSLHFLPQYQNSGTLAVTGLLVLGLAGLVAIWRSGGRHLAGR